MLSRDGPESRAFGGKNITNLTEALSGEGYSLEEDWGMFT